MGPVIGFYLQGRPGGARVFSAAEGYQRPRCGWAAGDHMRDLPRRYVTETGISLTAGKPSLSKTGVSHSNMKP